MTNNNAGGTFLTVILSVVFTSMAIALIGLVLERKTFDAEVPQEVAVEIPILPTEPIRAEPVAPIQPVQMPIQQPQVYYYPVQQPPRAVPQPTRSNTPTVAQIRAGHDAAKLKAVYQTRPTITSADIVRENPSKNALNYGKPQPGCKTPCYRCHR